MNPVLRFCLVLWGAALAAAASAFIFWCGGASFAKRGEGLMFAAVSTISIAAMAFIFVAQATHPKGGAK